MPLPHVSIGLDLYTGQRPAGSSRLRYRDAPVLAAGAEAAGFDAFWVGEHHAHEGVPRPVAATVDRVMQRLAGWPAIHIVLRALFPEADVSAQLDRIAALGEEVLPRINRH